jgi:hypothetical protein
MENKPLALSEDLQANINPKNPLIVPMLSIEIGKIRR